MPSLTDVEKTDKIRELFPHMRKEHALEALHEHQGNLKRALDAIAEGDTTAQPWKTAGSNNHKVKPKKSAPSAAAATPAAAKMKEPKPAAAAEGSKAVSQPERREEPNHRRDEHNHRRDEHNDRRQAYRQANGNPKHAEAAAEEPAVDRHPVKQGWRHPRGEGDREAVEGEKTRTWERRPRNAPRQVYDETTDAYARRTNRRSWEPSTTGAEEEEKDAHETTRQHYQSFKPRRQPDDTRRPQRNRPRHTDAENGKTEPVNPVGINAKAAGVWGQNVTTGASLAEKLRRANIPPTPSPAAAAAAEPVENGEINAPRNPNTKTAVTATEASPDSAAQAPKERTTRGRGSVRDTAAAAAPTPTAAAAPTPTTVAVPTEMAPAALTQQVDTRTSQQATKTRQPPRGGTHHQTSDLASPVAVAPPPTPVAVAPPPTPVAVAPTPAAPTVQQKAPPRLSKFERQTEAVVFPESVGAADPTVRFDSTPVERPPPPAQPLMAAQSTAEWNTWRAQVQSQPQAIPQRVGYGYNPTSVTTGTSWSGSAYPQPNWGLKTSLQQQQQPSTRPQAQTTWGASAALSQTQFVSQQQSATHLAGRLYQGGATYGSPTGPHTTGQHGSGVW